MLETIRNRLGVKLFVSYLVVIVIGVVVLALTTQLVIPSAFERHMASMGSMMSGTLDHSDMMGESMYANFQAGVMEALAWASLAATLAAAVVSWFVSRRVVTPIQGMMKASQRIAEGHYAERVQVPGAIDQESPQNTGDELGQLAWSFNQMAARLDQVEAMRRQLIGDVAHELRTPLTVIKGTMEGLMDGVLPAESQTYQQVHQEIDRLQRLVDDLQELSRVEAGVVPLSLQPVPIGRLVRTVTDRMGRLFEAKGVRLESNLPENLPAVLGDEDRLIQVIVNVVGNALKYTPEGGQVAISVTQQAKVVTLAVQDTGMGIAAEQLPHIFTRFYRVDKSRARASGGSGIGLTIAKVLVEAHGGTIWAESAGPGQGSSFFIALPIASK